MTSFQKRPSLRDKLDRMNRDDEEGARLRAEMREQLEKDREAAKTYGRIPPSDWRQYAIDNYVNPDGTFHCPYCKEAGTKGAATKYANLDDLIAHIKASGWTTRHNNGLITKNYTHDSLKSAAGWYDEGFESALDAPTTSDIPPTTPDTSKHERERGKQVLQELGITLDDSTVLTEPIPHESIPGLMRGPPPVTTEIPSDYANHSAFGTPSNLGRITPHHAVFVTNDTMPATPLSAEHSKHIATSRYARTAAWDPKAKDQAKKAKRG